MNAELDALVATLLEPIAGDRPTGRDVRYEGDYARIEEARRDEDARQPRGVWVRDIKQADWGLAERLCVGVLRSKSKDMRVACRLAEAWVHRHGFAGLAPGLRLLEGLATRYWADLQPDIDGDPGVHVAAVDWLNQRLPVVLRQVPVVVNALVPDQRYCWADHLKADQLETVRLQDAAAAQKAEAGGAVTLEMFEARRDRTATELFAATAADLAAALDALAALDAALDARCGPDAPGLSRIRNVAGEIADYAHGVLAQRQALVPAAALATIPFDPAGEAGPPIAFATPASREVAYRQLAAIADMLRVAEPHSPVPYVVDYLVEWASMTLTEIEAELQAGGGGMSALLEAIGIAPK